MAWTLKTLNCSQMVVVIVSTSDVAMLRDSKIWQPSPGGLAGALSPFQLHMHTHHLGILQGLL